MVTYALILILSINGVNNAYKMDTGLTQQDCEDAYAANPKLVAEGHLYCAVLPPEGK